jgi:hypothetical protein
MAHRFKMFDSVRITERIEAPGTFSLGEVCVVPAGELGTILEVYGGEAYEVEFSVGQDNAHALVLRPDQIEPAA